MALKEIKYLKGKMQNTVTENSEIFKGKSNEFSQSVSLNVAAGVIVSKQRN